MIAIEVKNLYRSFGDFNALTNINIQVHQGDIVGFIGPNGAGKTTTMKILATLDSPTKGFATVMGESCIHFPERVRRHLGFMPDYYGTYPQTTVFEYLDFFARTQNMMPQKRESRLAEILDYTELGNLADKNIDQLSKGMKQRVSLGRALVHDPEVLILDEPASGLDPRARIELRELLKLLATKLKKTILISSHILTELDETCDSIVLIEKGIVKHQGKISELVNTIEKEHRRENLLQLATLSPLKEVQMFLMEQPHVTEIEKHNGKLRLHFTGNESDQAHLLNHLVQHNFQILEFSGVQKNLEDVFMSLTDEGDKQ